MLKDRKKVKELIRALRYAAKNGDSIQFVEDKDYPKLCTLAYDKHQKIVKFNTLFLYRQKQ